MDQPQQEEAYLTCWNQTIQPSLHNSTAQVLNTGSLCNAKIFANGLRQNQNVQEFTHTHTQIKQGI